MTAADLVVDALAQSEAELLERLASLEADVVQYRELALEALKALHDVTTERDRLRANLRREREQHAALRAQLLAKDHAA
jgi:hypothetical protein